MRIVFKPYLVDRIHKAINEACDKDLPIEKIVVSRDEARQLESELRNGPILGFRQNQLFGYKLEIEDGPTR